MTVPKPCTGNRLSYLRALTPHVLNLLSNGYEICVISG